MALFLNIIQETKTKEEMRGKIMNLSVGILRRQDKSSWQSRILNHGTLLRNERYMHICSRSNHSPSSSSSPFIMLLLLLFLIFLSLLSNGGVFSSTCTTRTASRSFEKCMSLPTQQASLAWTFHPHNTTLECVFFGTFISASGWVGFGINPTSPEMTGTRALIGFSDPSSGQLVLLPYILDPNVKFQKSPLLSRPLDLQLLSSSAALYSGRMATIHGGATLEIFATIKLVPNRTRIHFVWNRGLYVQEYSPAIHPMTVNDLSSACTVDILSGTTNTKRSRSTQLKIAHGVINAAAWGIFLPIGAAVSRYLRPVQAIGPAWFYAHAGVQICGVFLGTIGFAMGIKLGELSPGTVYGLHRKLGFTAFCLGWLQTLALLFRPKTTNKFRKYWKSYHHFVGYSCVVLGVVNVFQGFEVMGEGDSSAKLCYCLLLSTLIGICISLEVNAWVVFCRKAKEEKMKREGLFGANSERGTE